MIGLATASRWRSDAYASYLRLCCAVCDSGNTRVLRGNVSPCDTHSQPGIRTRYTVLCRACGHLGEAVKREAA